MSTFPKSPRDPQAIVARAPRAFQPSHHSPSILPATTRTDEQGNITTVPPEPCPDLLTEDEAIRYLRLDLIDIEHPADTLRYYRNQGLLRATQVGKAIRYRRVELEHFLDNLTTANPR